MNGNVEIQRLTKAIAALANIIVETAIAKVRARQLEVTPPQPPVSNAPRGATDNLMTKKDVAAYLRVSPRTVQNLMKNRRLPHIKLGSRCVRFVLADVENELK